MISDTILSSYLCGILRKKGIEMGGGNIDCYAEGWGIRYRGRLTRRHIKMTRGKMTWQETATTSSLRSSISIMDTPLPEVMLVEDLMVGRKIGEILSLPADIAPLLAETRIAKREAYTTGYIPIPVLVLEC